MNVTPDVIRDFREKVSAEIDVEPEGLDRFVVYTPFMFDDGDHFVVLLRKYGERWMLTDEGHTFMHLSYGDVDLDSGARAKVIDQALASYRITRDRGELRVLVPDEQYGDALFSFVQAITRITATALWTRERVAGQFFEDLRTTVEQIVPAGRLKTEYFDPATDPDGLYRVDFVVNQSPRPCYIFAVANDHHAEQATIACYHYERNKVRFSPIVVYEDQTQINRRSLARLSAVVGKQFPSLAEKDRMTKYLQEDVLGNAE
jgi:hypothetical protein